MESMMYLVVENMIVRRLRCECQALCSNNPGRALEAPTTMPKTDEALLLYAGTA